jgi:hypothetical protein
MVAGGDKAEIAAGVNISLSRCGPAWGSSLATILSYHREIEMENQEESVKSFQAAIKKWQAEHDEIWQGLPDETKLACADVIFRAIDQHARTDETFRELIYNRLGLTMDGAYMVLQCAGALELSDNYDLSGTTTNIAI